MCRKRFALSAEPFVTPGLVPGIHGLLPCYAKRWMAGTSPAMTSEGLPTSYSHRFRPSIGVIVSFANSIPSMQLTFRATTSVPSGLLPRANTSTPQSMQS
jgi:hypothetical protein